MENRGTDAASPGFEGNITMRMRARGTGALVLILAGSALPSAQAHPRYRKELSEYFGPPLAARLNNCRTCHVTRGNDDQANGRVRNPFGARLHEVRDDLRKAGKKTKMPNRIEAVADEDSDHDGVANLIELLTGHFPGEAGDTPTADEVARGKAGLDEFKKTHPTSAWNPFDPVRRPGLPEVKPSGWALDPIAALHAGERATRGFPQRPDVPPPTRRSRRVKIWLTFL
jgi:mono/diheme cytochrome c family protein